MGITVVMTLLYPIDPLQGYMGGGGGLLYISYRPFYITSSKAICKVEVGIDLSYHIDPLIISPDPRPCGRWRWL